MAAQSNRPLHSSGAANSISPILDSTWAYGFTIRVTTTFAVAGVESVAVTVEVYVPGGVENCLQGIQSGRGCQWQTTEDSISHAEINRPVILIARAYYPQEIRDWEAHFFLDALNTGHRDSMPIIHANSAGDALRRFAHRHAQLGRGSVAGTY